MGVHTKYKNKIYASLVAVLVVLNVVAFSNFVRILKNDPSAQNVLMMEETGIPVSVIRQVTEAAGTAASDSSASGTSQSASDTGESAQPEGSAGESQAAPGVAQVEMDPQERWVQVLACLSVLYDGDFTRFSKEDLDVVLERIDAGEAAQTIAGNDESYAQYLEQYQQRIDSFKAIIGS